MPRRGERPTVAAGARPVQRQPTEHRIADNHGNSERTTKILREDGRRAHAAVYLRRTGDHWRVRGYSVGPRTILGDDYPESGA